MRNIIILLFCLAIFIHENEAVSSGANVASVSGAPYQNAVFAPVIMCSGCLVTPIKSLTTASCVNNLDPSEVQVLSGSTQYYNGGYTSNVALITKHAQFNPTTYDFNAAVLTFTEAIPSSEISSLGIVPIPLASAPPQSYTYYAGTGYGATDPQLTLPDYLQKVYLTAFPTAFCQKWKSNRLTPCMFCAGDTKGAKDFCPEDQGAPFVLSSVLYGIYNWGCSCGLAASNPSTPVFTGAYAIKSWVDSI